MWCEIASQSPLCRSPEAHSFGLGSSETSLFSSALCWSLTLNLSLHLPETLSCPRSSQEIAQNHLCSADFFRFTFSCSGVVHCSCSLLHHFCMLQVKRVTEERMSRFHWNGFFTTLTSRQRLAWRQQKLLQVHTCPVRSCLLCHNREIKSETECVCVWGHARLAW